MGVSLLTLILALSLQDSGRQSSSQAGPDTRLQRLELGRAHYVCVTLAVATHALSPSTHLGGASGGVGGGLRTHCVGAAADMRLRSQAAGQQVLPRTAHAALQQRCTPKRRAGRRTRRRAAAQQHFSQQCTMQAIQRTACRRVILHCTLSPAQPSSSTSTSAPRRWIGRRAAARQHVSQPAGDHRSTLLMCKDMHLDRQHAQPRPAAGAHLGGGSGGGLGGGLQSFSASAAS